MEEIPLDQLFQNSAVGVTTFSVGGRFVSANAAFCRLLGYTAQELLEKTHLDVIHLEDLEVAALTRAQAIAGKAKPGILERRYVHKDGSTVWTHAADTVIRDDAGTPQYTVLLVVDITRMKRSLRSSEQRFKRMLEMSSDWYWMQDTEFRFAEVPGLDAQDLDTDVVIGKARWELPNLASLPEKVWEQHRARLKRHEPFSDFVFLRYNRAGELRYLSVSGEPLFDEQGTFKGYHGIGKDITARARDAFEDRSGGYLQRIWRHEKKNGDLVHVKVVSMVMEFAGRQARLGVIHDLTEQIDAELRAREVEERYRQLLMEREKQANA